MSCILECGAWTAYLEAGTQQEKEDTEMQDDKRKFTVYEDPKKVWFDVWKAYKQGICNKGDQCDYSHKEDPEGKIQQT